MPSAGVLPLVQALTLLPSRTPAAPPLAALHTSEEPGSSSCRVYKSWHIAVPGHSLVKNWFMEQINGTGTAHPVPPLTSPRHWCDFNAQESLAPCDSHTQTAFVSTSSAGTRQDSRHLSYCDRRSNWGDWTRGQFDRHKKQDKTLHFSARTHLLVYWDIGQESWCLKPFNH